MNETGRICLFEDGSWEYELDASKKIDEKSLKFIMLTIGYNWLDSEVSQMVSDYYNENTLSWVFDQ